MAETPSYNFTIKQGATWSATLTLANSNGTAKDLSGYTAKMDIRSKVGGKLYKSLSSGSGITITGSSGLVALALTADEALALNFDKAEFDLFLTSGLGTKTCILGGEIILERAVTQ